MAGLLDKVTVDLEPTATYARREAAWIPGAEPGEGVLEVWQWRGRRAGSKVEFDRYEVQPDEPIGVYGRAFLLLNTTDPEQPDVYRCVVGPNPTCTCKAGLCRVDVCKHRDALAALINDGVL